MPHVPEQASAKADAFAHLLARDGYGPTTVLRTVGVIIDHARAARLRCDASAELVRLEHIGPDVPLMSDRIIHGLAKHTAMKTRRDLPRLEAAANPWETFGKGAVSERTRDAGHDLLSVLIMDVP